MNNNRDDRWRERMRIRFDYTNLLTESIGEPGGVPSSDIEAMAGRVANAVYELQEARARGDGRPRMFVLDNVDPDFVTEVLDSLDLKRTVFNVWANPAALNALLLYLHHQRGRNIDVLVPYSQRLIALANWFRQLWAESIDPFNQPGVEASKIATYALLGRSGYEARTKELARSRDQGRRIV